MKTITKLALFAIILTSFNLFAQGHHSGKWIETLATELGLTEQQEVQIQAIMEANKPNVTKKCSGDGNCHKSKDGCDKKRGDGDSCHKPKEKCGEKSNVQSGKMCKQKKGMKENMRAHREKIQTEIEAILTPEQVTKFREIVAAKHAMRSCDKSQKHCYPAHSMKHSIILHSIFLLAIGVGFTYLGTMIG